MNERERMICIHSHVLYGIDDGAEDFTMAKMLLMYAREEGIRQMIMSPHSMDLQNCPQAAKEAFDKLNAYLEANYPDMAIYPGCEVYCEPRMMNRVLEKLENGVFPTLNHTNYVLSELDPRCSMEDASFCVKTLVEHGYIPVIAHLERYRFLQGEQNLVEKLRSLGAMVQVNVSSLYDGTENPEVLWARQLVLDNKVDFLGTDCHRTYYRPPSSQMGLWWLEDMVEKGQLHREYVQSITWGNAQRFLIEGENRRLF